MKDVKSDRTGGKGGRQAQKQLEDPIGAGQEQAKRGEEPGENNDRFEIQPWIVATLPPREMGVNSSPKDTIKVGLTLVENFGVDTFWLNHRNCHWSGH